MAKFYKMASMCSTRQGSLITALTTNFSLAAMKKLWAVSNALEFLPYLSSLIVSIAKSHHYLLLNTA